MFTTGSTHHHPMPPHASQSTRAPSDSVFGWGGRAASRSQWESKGGGGRRKGLNGVKISSILNTESTEGTEYFLLSRINLRTVSTVSTS